jgi:hypothetical protein
MHQQHRHLRLLLLGWRHMHQQHQHHPRQ